MTVSPEESVKNIRQWIHVLIGWDIPQFSPKNTKLVVRASGAVLIGLIVTGWAIELRPEAHKTPVAQSQKIAPSGKILEKKKKEAKIISNNTHFAESLEEVTRKKRIREQLGKFRERLLSYEVAVRSGWDAEMMKRSHREDPSSDIEQYLRDNLDEYYAARFIYPEVEDLSKKKYDVNPYIGQGESESARAKLRFLDKIMDDIK